MKACNIVIMTFKDIFHQCFVKLVTVSNVNTSEETIMVEISIIFLEKFNLKLLLLLILLKNEVDCFVSGAE